MRHLRRRASLLERQGQSRSVAMRNAVLEWSEERWSRVADVLTSRGGGLPFDQAIAFLRTHPGWELRPELLDEG